MLILIDENLFGSFEHAIFCAIINSLLLYHLGISASFKFLIFKYNRYALWVIIYLIDFQLLWIMYK